MDDGLGKPKFRNAVGQHPAQFVQGLEYGDLDPLGRQISGNGQAARPGTDGCDLDIFPKHGTIVAPGEGIAGVLGIIGIGHKPFQTPDGNGFARGIEFAMPLALVLLGTDTAAHRRQAVGVLDDPVGLVDIPLGNGMDEPLTVDFDRTTALACGVLALQAARGLQHGLVL